MDLRFLTLLLACQLTGEVISAGVNLPVPGPVIGMLILFCGLLIRGRVPEHLAAVSNTILRHLSLLFVPAGVGVMLHASILAEEWWPISLALVGSAVCTLAVTALALRWLLAKWPGTEGAGT